MSSETTFILGGARSGKSRFAEQSVVKSGLKPVYIATGRAFDDSMVDRIHHHRDRRGDEWTTVEEPLALVDALRQSSFPGSMILVDCLTLWITNLMMAEADVIKECAGLIEFLGGTQVPVVLVSNETGQGVIPDNAMAREFTDLAGSVHQEVAAACDHVYLVTAGIPQKLK
ncbi:MAG: bifunctional adenosylcobinamide kinase/adenosylcobinamide-phosphate guanylyltransferase [Rhizobiaceae bacterium]|jgi:adenosylcobinamide kinase/adenosylcobinamide-phosphate guanylyltransferase|nr:bifunctional adenosylcobinamide kinase/adenosylcobinamide-phosphate guanylyltransferase [Rhizobiaceae bacterium]